MLLPQPQQVICSLMEPLLHSVSPFGVEQVSHRVSSNIGDGGGAGAWCSTLWITRRVWGCEWDWFEWKWSLDRRQVEIKVVTEIRDMNACLFYFCLFLLLNDKFIIGSESCYTAWNLIQGSPCTTYEYYNKAERLIPDVSVVISIIQVVRHVEALMHKTCVKNKKNTPATNDVPAWISLLIFLPFIF
jgi:hypothetical protein